MFRNIRYGQFILYGINQHRNQTTTVSLESDTDRVVYYTGRVTGVVYESTRIVSGKRQS
jgi:hypothetical protein